MYTTGACPCCNSTKHKRWPSVVAPFLADYACNEAPKRCFLCECLDCSFRFFDSRLTDEEVLRLYSSYRRDSYFTARHRHEFWYSRTANDGLGSDAGEIESRRLNLTKFIDKAALAGDIETVLDYGGDRGQFIPDGLGRKRYVYEISDAAPAEGICRLDSIEGRQFDFIMLGHVLEHCSEPAEMMKSLRSYGHGETLYYFEVPYERVNMDISSRGRLKEKYLDLLLRVRPALTAMDLLSTVARIKWNIIPPLGFPKCSEHLNFFNERSARALLERSGYRMHSCNIAGVTASSKLSRVLQVLAYKA